MKTVEKLEVLVSPEHKNRNKKSKIDYIKPNKIQKLDKKKKHNRDNSESEFVKKRFHLFSDMRSCVYKMFWMLNNSQNKLWELAIIMIIFFIWKKI